MNQRIIKVGHSPDADDAFMFYGLSQGKVDTGELQFREVLEDIETLNRRALRGELELTAVSIHAYASLTGRYALTDCGCSMGDRYGPALVARQPLEPDQLHSRTIGVPGTLTTAFLCLKLLLRADFAYEVLPFDQIIDAVAQGAVDAGLVIHEGQLTFADRGLHQVIDLGQWWHDQTGLPLPLGGNAIRKDLGPELMRRINGYLRASIEYGLEHRDQALAYARQYASNLSLQQVDRFVSMYVNEWTLSYGAQGRQAVQTLLDRAFQAGLITKPVTAEFVQ